MSRSAAQVIVSLVAGLRGLAGTALGVGLVALAAGDDSEWTALVVVLGVICLVFGLVSLAQSAMVWSGRGRLMAVAAIVEAGHLLLWLWALPVEEQPLAHLFLVAGIVVLCALATSMWRRAA